MKIIRSPKTLLPTNLERRNINPTQPTPRKTLHENPQSYTEFYDQAGRPGRTIQPGSTSSDVNGRCRAYERDPRPGT